MARNKACAQDLISSTGILLRQGERFVHAANDIKRAARSRSMYKVIALTREVFKQQTSKSEKPKPSNAEQPSFSKVAIVHERNAHPPEPL